MAKYDFFLNYAGKDRELAQIIADLLKERGYSVCDSCDLCAGISYAEKMAHAISESECFVPIITEAYSSSDAVLRELDFALTKLNERAKLITPLMFTEGLSRVLQYYLGRFQLTHIKSRQDLLDAIDDIDNKYKFVNKPKALYEKLTEYKGLKSSNNIVSVACELLNLICEKWEHTPKSSVEQLKDMGSEIYRLLREIEYASTEKLSKDNEAKLLTVISKIEDNILTLREPLSQDKQFEAFFVSLAIKVLFSHFVIRNRFDQDAPLWTIYIGKQREFIEAYLAFEAQLSDYDFKADDMKLVLDAKNAFLFEKEASDFDEYILTLDSDNTQSNDDEILLAVAEHMSSGNKLFDVLQGKGLSGDFLHCLLTSYERLKSYCEVVGAKDTAAECVDRIIDLRNEIDFDKPGKRDERVENGIKSLLGITLKNSGNYDVFISFKSEDSDLAEKVYNLCQRHMKVPFWSKRTLSQLSKSDYAEMIDMALDNSKHFVVVLSKKEYLQTEWVSYEMRTFFNELKEGRKVDGNFIIVATDSLAEELKADKKLLPIAYRNCEIIKMSDYESIMSYIV